MRRVMQLDEAFPLRPAAIHYCGSNPAVEAIANFLALLGGNSVMRYRAHSGSHVEVQYKLMTFGIPIRSFPISASGDVDVSRHKNFVRQRILLENTWAPPSSSSSPPSAAGSTARSHLEDRSNQRDRLVVVPNKLDICLGRGTRIMEHVGT
jgi:hypothetical protein